MADDQVKELSPAFAGSGLEETVPVPIEVEGTVVVSPQSPPSNLDNFEAWPSEVLVQAFEPYDSECLFIDDRDIGLSVEVGCTENGSNSKNGSESESGRKTLAALGVQADIAAAQSWPEEEEIYGRLHLYKTYRKGASKDKVKHSSMLGILNLPGMVTRINLRDFLAPFREAIDEVKIIKENTPSRYVALIRFNAEDIADTFYKVYNGCSFNQKDSEACQLVRVGRFEVQNSRGRASFTMKNLIELPRCTICLERTGESLRSTFTWLCDQSFEGQSQQSQNATECPVCTYCHVGQQEDPRCLECGIMYSLHICLICGLVTCGRDMRGHADKHFNETEHAYGMQLYDHKVWDYIEDKYVKSAICHSSSNIRQYLRQANEQESGAVELGYTYLLPSQLESQQIFWEQKIIQLQKESNEKMNNTKTKLASTIEKCNKLKHDINDLLKQKQAVEEKCTHLNTKISKLFIELKDEQNRNKCLIASQVLLQNQLKEEEKILKETCKHIDRQITEIQGQLQDIIFYLEAQQKSSDLSIEIREEMEEEEISIAMDVSSSSPEEEEL